MYLIMMGSFIPFIQHLKEICLLHAQTITTNSLVCDRTSEDLTGVTPNEYLVFEKREIQTSHLKSLSCDVTKCCGQAFKTLACLREHNETMDHRGLKVCKFCHEHFKKEDLLKHKIVVHKEVGEKWKCELCNKLNFSKWSLMVHINYHHLRKENTYKCGICALTFHCSISYEKHLKKHKISKPKRTIFPIKCCGKIFYNQTYYHHLKSLSHQGLVACRKCKIVVKKEALIKHNAEIHQCEGKRTCEDCNKYFRTRDSYVRHRKNIHSENVHKCSVCASIFYNKESYEKHCETHSSIPVELPKGLFKCCGMVLTKANYTQHVNSLTHQGLASCRVCFQVFRKGDLVKHKAEVHREFEGKLECEDCKKYFKTKEGFITHREQNHSENVYRCSVCPSISYSRDSYEKHCETHRNNSEITTDPTKLLKGLVQCCGKVFPKANYQPHLRTLAHQGLVTCGLCHKVFKKEVLVKHRADVHQEIEKKWKCKVCNKLFSYRKSLNAHLQSSHQDLPAQAYLCQICGKMFISYAKREQHYKKMHLGANKQGKTTTA
ncbi:hypothetical protein FOCC_FOCC000539 [Frankliniella occidentalis]|nr:hypothetical protein FOCC_FOCC000539 [Frankliniella occidentalis]